MATFSNAIFDTFWMVVASWIFSLGNIIQIMWSHFCIVCAAIYWLVLVNVLNTFFFF